MRYRFIGQYTLGRTSICMNGVTFEGHEPSEVPADIEFRFAGNIEFAAVHPLDHDGDGKPGGSLPRKRGRPRKA